MSCSAAFPVWLASKLLMTLKFKNNPLSCICKSVWSCCRSQSSGAMCSLGELPLRAAFSALWNRECKNWNVQGDSLAVRLALTCGVCYPWNLKCSLWITSELSGSIYSPANCSPMCVYAHIPFFRETCKHAPKKCIALWSWLGFVCFVLFCFFFFCLFVCLPVCFNRNKNNNINTIWHYNFFVWFVVSQASVA